MPRSKTAVATPDPDDKWSDLDATEGEFVLPTRPVPPAILAQAKTLVDSHKVQFDIHERDAKYVRDLRSHMLRAVRELAPGTNAQAKIGHVSGRKTIRFTTPRKTD